MQNKFVQRLTNKQERDKSCAQEDGRLEALLLVVEGVVILLDSVEHILVQGQAQADAVLDKRLGHVRRLTLLPLLLLRVVGKPGKYSGMVAIKF